MIRRTRLRLAGLAAAATLAAGLGLALAAAPAYAAGPSCATQAAPGAGLFGHCEYNNGDPGAAGFYGANDGHTHYRTIYTVLFDTAQLIDINGNGRQGAVGVQLCDNNDHALGGGYATQFGLVGVQHRLYYSTGFYQSGAADPCVTGPAPHTSGLLIPDPTPTSCPPGGAGDVLGVSGTINPPYCGSFLPVVPGDEIALAINYLTSGSKFHDLQFEFCDVTQGYCQQNITKKPVQVNWWEWGVGVFSENSHVGAPPSVPVTMFDTSRTACASCASEIPITDVVPVNPFGTGGLTNAAYINDSSQVTMSTLNSLQPDGSFGVWNGSTS